MSRSVHWTLGTLVASVIAACCMAQQAQAAAAQAGAALVTQDRVALRAGPRDSASVQTPLWRGELLELRSERGDYYQVWEPYRERGGYVNKNQVLRIDNATPDDLLAMLTLVRDTPGAEGLGLGLGAAAIQAATAQWLTAPQGAATLDALGRSAERLADRASAGTPNRVQEQVALAASLDVAARYGVKIQSREIDGRMRYCYDDDAFLRILGLKAASAEQKARAAWALTRGDCRDPAASPRALEEADQWSAELLDRIADQAPGTTWKNRLATRRATLWSSLAYARERRGDAAAARTAVDHALADLASVEKAELADADLDQWNEAALRLNGVRWASEVSTTAEAGPGVRLDESPDGQTCMTLVDPKLAPSAVAARRCTWGVVWRASVRVNPQGNALTLAVQPQDGWTELWVFRRQGNGKGDAWSVSVLPPAASDPGLGYAEFAGWVPGGRQMLVAREAVTPGRTIRRFEIVTLDGLGVERTAFEANALGAFSRWGDPRWRGHSLALR